MEAAERAMSLFGERVNREARKAIPIDVLIALAMQLFKLFCPSPTAAGVKTFCKNAGFIKRARMISGLVDAGFGWADSADAVGPMMAAGAKANEAEIGDFLGGVQAIQAKEAEEPAPA